MTNTLKVQCLSENDPMVSYCLKGPMPTISLLLIIDRQIWYVCVGLLIMVNFMTTMKRSEEIGHPYLISTVLIADRHIWYV